jgi:hypothetical protein
MYKIKSGDGISIQYIYGELLLNAISTMATFKMLISINNSLFLIPILLEKIFTFGMIIGMFCIKKKFETIDYANMESEYSDNEDWHSVKSEYSDNEDWHSVESEYSDDEDWHSVESIDLSI